MSRSAPSPARFRRGVGSRRRGITTLYLILLFPALFILLCLIIEIGNLWLARLELEDGLESAALAAVKEWAESGGGGTLVPREQGQEFARANSMRDEEISILLNRDPGNINENALLVGPDANLVFGAITSLEPQVVFNANVIPSCGPRVLVDATGKGNLTDNNNSLGISFLETTSPGVRIDQVIFDLTLTSPSLTFQSGTFTLSDNVAPHKIQDNCPQGKQTQPDNVGIGPGDFNVALSSGNQLLTLDFTLGGTVVSTFELLDQMRFGVSVLQGTSSVDGDELAQFGGRVTIVFSNGAQITEPFFDNQERSNECLKCAIADPRGLIIHPTLIPDLPCPETSASPQGGGNGQSYAGANGGAGDDYAVRAQATLEVPSVCDQLFGCRLGPFTVSADTVAMYDCMKRCPLILRVDEFLP